MLFRSRQGRSWDSGLWRVGSSSDGAGGQQVEILMDENGTVYRDSRSTQPGVPPVVPATPATPATPPATPVLPGESVAPPLPRQSVTDSEAGWLLLIRRGSDAERRQAARELTRFPSRDSVLALVDALKRDGSEQVRQQAAHTLGTMLAYETLEDLRQAARTDRDAGVRATALTSVQKIEAYYRLG